jgi:hypothetical protein
MNDPRRADERFRGGLLFSMYVCPKISMTLRFVTPFVDVLPKRATRGCGCRTTPTPMSLRGERIPPLRQIVCQSFHRARCPGGILLLPLTWIPV